MVIMRVMLGVPVSCNVCLISTPPHSTWKDSSCCAARWSMRGGVERKSVALARLSCMQDDRWLLRSSSGLDLLKISITKTQETAECLCVTQIGVVFGTN